MTNNEYEYLDLLERKLDPVQKKSCFAEGNTVVAAGAGSGKTQVLATRFAWLVMSKNVPANEILTLTFTNKAAGEMYERIYKTLNFFAKNSETPSPEKERAAQALEDFSEVHIQTLDSYCSSIVRQAANQYGIRPDFSIGGSEAKENIKNLALPFVFANQNNKAIKGIVNPGDFQNFANTILSKTIEKHTSLVSPDNFFSEKLSIQKETICNLWNYLVCAKGEVPDILSDTLQEWDKYTNEKECICLKNFKEAFENFGLFLEQGIQEDSGDKFILAFTPVYEKLSISAKAINIVLDKDDDFSSKKIQDAANLILEINSYYKINHKNGSTKLPAIKSLKAFSQFFKNCMLQTLIQVANYILQFEEIKALFSLMDDFLARINQSKRVSGSLTFNDVSELALKILHENKEIRTREQNSFSQIMIDEFQDNNSKNRDLLFLLCGDKKKLFFVGDEKQSIYKFRGADVSVFNSLKKEDSITEAESMTFNYRSTLEMITAFNRMFAGDISIFNNKTKELFEATYTKNAYKYDPVAKKVLNFPHLTQETVPLHMCLLNKNLITQDHISEKDQQAYYIAKKISELLKDNELRPSDIAVLDKSRTDRKYLTKWLNYFNIPYIQDQNCSLFADGPVNDIYNYLRLCVYPSDKNSLAAYYASPFNAMSANQVINQLATETDFYMEDQKQVLSQSLCKTIQDLWLKKGYYYETILNNNTAQFESEFDLLFELARRCDANGKSVSWFVDQLEFIKNGEEKSEEVEIDTSEVTFPLEKGDSVQIMTIHKSKGLQFTKVFLYGCIGANSKADKDNFFFDEKVGATFCTTNSANIFYALQKSYSKTKELAEFRRILYVGITRAIDEIFIVGSWNPCPKKESKNPLHLLEFLINVYYPQVKDNENSLTGNLPFNKDSPFDLLEIIPVLKEQAYRYKGDEKSHINLELIRDKYQKEEGIITEIPVSIRKTPSSLEENYDRKKSTDGDSGEKFEQSKDTITSVEFTAADFGVLVHSYLEVYANGIEPENYEPEPKLLKNLSETEIKENKEICIRMTREFLAQEIGKEFLQAKQAGRFYKAEWAFRMWYQEAIFTGSIDLIFQNPDGTYTIVDYKSDNEINCKKYRRQQDCYRHAASEILGISENNIRCVLYFLKHKTLCNTFED